MSNTGTILNKAVDPKKHVTNFGQNHSSTFFKPLIQTKLTVNSPNDSYEQEADAVADKIMRMTDKDVVQTKFFKPAMSSIQGKCEHCEEEERKTRDGHR